MRAAKAAGGWRTYLGGMKTKEEQDRAIEEASPLYAQTNQELTGGTAGGGAALLRYEAALGGRKPGAARAPHKETDEERMDSVRKKQTLKDEADLMAARKAMMALDTEMAVKLRAARVGEKGSIEESMQVHRDFTKSMRERILDPFGDQYYPSGQ
jgi:hypothetical protein